MNKPKEARKMTEKLAAQRKRRNSRQRVDYYPSKEAFAVIQANTPRRKGGGGNFSKALDRFVLEWAGSNIPELPRMESGQYTSARKLTNELLLGDADAG